MICVTKSLDVHLKLTPYKSTVLRFKKEKEKKYNVKGSIFTAAVSLNLARLGRRLEGDHRGVSQPLCPVPPRVKDIVLHLPTLSP